MYLNLYCVYVDGYVMLSPPQGHDIQFHSNAKTNLIWLKLC